MYLRVAYNNAHRNILKFHMRCSTSQMYVDNDLLHFEALIRIKTNTFISRLTVSDNTIIKVSVMIWWQEKKCGRHEL